jgi:hypothetical protein
VTDEEYNAITARVAVLGISRQRLMVEAATARPARPADRCTASPPARPTLRELEV